MTPQPTAGDTLTAGQELCGTISPPSVGVVVKPCPELPPPRLRPIRHRETKISVTKAVVVAHIQVYNDGCGLVAVGGGPVINLLTPAKAGQNVAAVQTIGTCVSKASSPLAVGCVVPEQLPLGI